LDQGTELKMPSKDNAVSECCGETDLPLILACSGGSNVGQMTNRIAVELTEAEYGKMFCLAGIGAGLEQFVNSVMKAQDVIVLDGCLVACARKSLERIRKAPAHCFELTAMGMHKHKSLHVDETDVQKLVQQVKIGYAKEKMAARGGGCACCG
jgi:uncharacterized metal-binding protein